VFLVCLLLFVAVAAARYLPTPGGLAVWHECFHEVKSGDHIDDRGLAGVWVTGTDGLTRKLPSCSRPTIPRSRARRAANPSASVNLQGWQTWTSFNNFNNASFTTFNGNFTVPSAPTQWPTNPDSAVIYVFTGLQNDNWVPNGLEPVTPTEFEIIQPVLQFGGGSVNGGGKFWGVASWYVTVDAGALFSKTTKLNPGDSIYGVMQQTGATSWLIGAQASGIWTNLTVNKNRLVSNPWAYNTLETYDILSCDWLPTSSTKFSNLILIGSQGQQVTPSWTVHTEPGTGSYSDQCHSNFTTSSPSLLTLTYQNAF